MRKLLSANFMRLWKDKFFWIGMAAMAVFAAFISVNNYIDMQYEPTPALLDDIFFAYASAIGILIAVFCALFIGTEYNDGTIRNKIVVGHTRTAVYLSNLITCLTAGILMMLSYITVMFALGVPLIGFFVKLPLQAVLIYFGISVMMSVAFSALFTMLCMLNQNKAISAVVAILGVFAMLLLASVIKMRLEAPEFYDGYVFTTNDPSMQNEKIPNHKYLSGEKRKAYQLALDVLPTGQSLSIASVNAENLWQMPVYSLILVVVTTGAGLLLFEKKDMK